MSPPDIVFLLYYICWRLICPELLIGSIVQQTTSLALPLKGCQPYLILVLLFIGLMPNIWFIANYDNYEYSDLKWLKEALKKFIIFGPIFIVWIVFFLYFLMDVRLITSGIETKGNVMREQSEVYVYKSSGKVSSSSYGVVYSYVVHDEEYESIQKFFNRSSLPKIGNTTIVYDSAFPIHSSKLAGTYFPHAIGFLPLLLWLTIGSLIWSFIISNRLY